MPDVQMISADVHEARMSEARASNANLTEQIRITTDQLTSSRSQNVALAEENARLLAENTRLGAENRTAVILTGQNDGTVKALREAQRALETRVMELTAERDEALTASLGAKVKATIEEAIKVHKLAPAIFAGYEPDPVGFVSKYAGTAEQKILALTDFVSALRGTGKAGNTTVTAIPSSVGAQDKTGDSADTDAVQLTDVEKKLYERAKLGSGEFIGVTNEQEGRERWLAAQAAKKKDN